MRREEVLQRLRERRSALAARGVSALYLYGSVARDEAGPDSDVDLLVASEDCGFTAFDLIEVQRLLTAWLDSPVEAHDYGGFERLPAFRERVERDLVRVF